MTRDLLLQELLKSINKLNDRIGQLESVLQNGLSPPKDIMNSEETCAFLGVTPSWLDKICSNREITYYKRRKLRVFKRTDLENFLLSNPILSDEAIDNEAEEALMRRKNHR